MKEKIATWKINILNDNILLLLLLCEYAIL